MIRQRVTPESGACSSGERDDGTPGERGHHDGRGRLTTYVIVALGKP